MDTTTIRLQPQTIQRLRGYKRHPRATDDEALNWVLDQLIESDEEINALHDEIEKLKKETST